MSSGHALQAWHGPRCEGRWTVRTVERRSWAQVTAVLLDRGTGDAEVKIKDETKVDREHGSASRAKTESEFTLDRGHGPRLNVVAITLSGRRCE